MLVRFSQRLRCSGEDRVHAARADACAEQLFGKLDSVLPRDTVAHRQRCDRRLQARTERAGGHLVQESRARASTALRAAAQSLATVLTHPHRDQRQLFDLVTRGLVHHHTLIGTEHVPAAAALGPVLDDRVNCPRRKQRPAVALMSVLDATLAARRVLAMRRRRRRVRARRARRVARALPQLPLKPLHPRLQLLDAPIHTQENLDDDLPTSVIDRLRLHTVHTPIFDTPGLRPPNPLNAY
jgi:hypothetical protein